MKKLVSFAAFGEAATRVVLLIVPSFVGWLLFGQELTGVAIPVARVAGITLIALGVGCWPGSKAIGTSTRALLAMLCYSLLATLYLAYLGMRGMGRGSVAAGGGAPRHIDDSSGSRTA